MYQEANVHFYFFIYTITHYHGRFQGLSFLYIASDPYMENEETTIMHTQFEKDDRLPFLPSRNFHTERAYIV